MRFSPRDAVRSRCLQRLAAVLGLAGLVGVPPPVQAARQQLESRVQAVRQALQAQADEAPQPAAGKVSDGRRRLAQWMNWPNWGNWANWSNWNNWPNWGNWGNWFNR